MRRVHVRAAALHEVPHARQRQPVEHRVQRAHGGDGAHPRLALLRGRARRQRGLAVAGFLQHEAVLLALVLGGAHVLDLLQVQLPVVLSLGVVLVEGEGAVVELDVQPALGPRLDHVVSLLHDQTLHHTHAARVRHTPRLQPPRRRHHRRQLVHLRRQQLRRRGEHQTVGDPVPQLRHRIAVRRRDRLFLGRAARAQAVRFGLLLVLILADRPHRLSALLCFLLLVLRRQRALLPRAEGAQERLAAPETRVQHGWVHDQSDGFLHRRAGKIRIQKVDLLRCEPASHPEQVGQQLVHHFATRLAHQAAPLAVVPHRDAQRVRGALRGVH
mmetsp:Transcript_4896/g.15821  ORF Transcript_4896/g.15821 Transcript_4896/m.15821 type:complete len:328 (+) Transcript_4896:756-1739(+)